MAKYVVRYGSMRILRPFGCSGKYLYRRGQEVIVRTDRGLETGEVLCEATEEQIEKLGPAQDGQILREMSNEDRNEIARIHGQEKNEFDVCLRCIRELELEMQLVDIEHIFGGERIVVYYLADGRVDFRELVKKLAGEFQTRIEMRQIGVRDEAKLMADYGDCGKAVCCNNHLVSMPPVSMKMAKLQKATLDPTKISGRCGRLKCCLRYEYETYEAGLAEMPAVGAFVETPDGRGRVIGQEILARQVFVETEDRVRKLVSLDDVTTCSPEDRSKPKRTKQPPQS